MMRHTPPAATPVTPAASPKTGTGFGLDTVDPSPIWNSGHKESLNYDISTLKLLLTHLAISVAPPALE